MYMAKIGIFATRTSRLTQFELTQHNDIRFDNTISNYNNTDLVNPLETKLQCSTQQLCLAFPETSTYSPRVDDAYVFYGKPATSTPGLNALSPTLTYCPVNIARSHNSPRSRISRCTHM